MAILVFLVVAAGSYAQDWDETSGLVLLQSDAIIKNRIGTLPPVDTLMQNSETLKRIRTNTEMLKTSVEGKLTEHMERLTRMKTSYEGKLQKQQTENEEIRVTSDKLNQENTMLIHQNDVLRNYSLKLVTKNQKLRDELKELEHRLVNAKSFATNSLQTTEISPDDLKSLQNKGPESKQLPNEQSLLSNLKSEDSVDDAIAKLADRNEYQVTEESKSSLLEVSRGMGNTESAKSILDLEDQPVGTNELRMMSEELNKLSAEEEESERKIKTAFSDQYRTGSNLRMMLTNQKRAREERHNSLVTLQKNLQATQMRLQTIHTQLQQRLHGLSLFLKRAANMTTVTS